jgi:hypothetical protein
MSGSALILWIAGVHLLGLAAVAFLMFPALKDNPTAPDPRFDDGDDGWGRRGPKTPPQPPERPRGGIPLLDAEQARIRLREPGRLSEQLPQRNRRPAREPERVPARSPHPSR